MTVLGLGWVVRDDVRRAVFRAGRRFGEPETLRVNQLYALLVLFDWLHRCEEVTRPAPIEPR